MSDQFFSKLSQAVLILTWALPLTAQTVDTGILGTVTDPGGAVIANAIVTIDNPATGLKRTVKSAQDGKYELRYLIPGQYSVEAQAPGFRTGKTNSITIQLNQQVRIDF